MFLATGRPVITQDTGFGNVLPTGDGLGSCRTRCGTCTLAETKRSTGSTAAERSASA